MADFSFWLAQMPKDQDPGVSGAVPPLDQPLTAPSCPSLSPGLVPFVRGVPTLRFAPLSVLLVPTCDTPDFPLLGDMTEQHRLAIR